MTKKEGMPLPGDIVQHDFREALPKNDVTTPQALRIVQWNVERGYELPGIIAELQELDADIIGLQEIDVHCERYAPLLHASLKDERHRSLQEWWSGCRYGNRTSA